MTIPYHLGLIFSLTSSLSLLSDGVSLHDPLLFSTTPKPRPNPETTPLTTHLSSPNHHHSRHFHYFHFPSTQYFPHAISLHQKHSSYPNASFVSGHVPFSEEYEAGFVKRVLEKLGNPAETVVCVLGIFDGISIKVAELLFKHGFKEAYAIKGGVGGTKWWLESQETLLPPSMHIYPKKKVKTSQETVTNTGVVRGKVESNGAATSTNLSTGESQTTDNGRTTKATDSVSLVKNGSRSSSPCPSYQDLKPPSSPTPSKP